MWRDTGMHSTGGTTSGRLKKALISKRYIRVHDNATVAASRAQLEAALSRVHVVLSSGGSRSHFRNPKYER